MAFSARGGVRRVTAFSPREVRDTIADTKLGAWLSSLLEEVVTGAEFTNNDFAGKKGDVVSMQEVILAMAFFAKTMGYSESWELVESQALADFERRPAVYKAVLKKVENWSTLTGGRKLSSVKKAIRVRVSAKVEEVRAKPNPLGVFVGDAASLAKIYRDTNFKRVVCGLHKLGNCSEDDPRYYIHMIYRYYMGDFHRQLADRGKVLRFPTLQKVMDIRRPVNCVGSMSPEFRLFVKHSRNSVVLASTLPVPSKTRSGEIVYGYDFEVAVPWVPVMRAKIFDTFAELSSCDSPDLFRQVYPAYLIKGEEGGCEEGNRVVLAALARSIEVTDILQTLKNGMRSTSADTARFLDRVLSADPRVASVYQRYNNHPFCTHGEQLRERLGFLLQDSVRGVFRHISSKMASFCNDMYTTLSVPFVTMDVFNEFCTTGSSMKFQRRGEGVWREFLSDVCRICSVLHAWSRRREVEQFMNDFGSTDLYLGKALDSIC